jgi:hypothetical protein
MKAVARILSDKRVDSISDERSLGDGFWVYLKAGFQCDPATHVIHENSPTACLKRLVEITKCQCEACTQE